MTILSYPAMAVVCVVWGLTQVFKKRFTTSPIKIGWYVALVATGIIAVTFPSQITLQLLSEIIVGVFAVQGFVKNLHESGVSV